MISDLKYAETLCSMLRLNGDARLEYFTAELQPFSNQQKPDIIFIPSAGPFAGQVTFIEIKLRERTLSTNRIVEVVGERKQFAQEALEKQIGRYVLITELKVSDLSKKLLRKQRIQILDETKTPEDALAALV